jgi:hypothetical protein
MLNAEAICSSTFPGTHTYDEKDAILYALSVGALAGPFAEAGQGGATFNPLV